MQIANNDGVSIHEVITRGRGDLVFRWALSELNGEKTAEEDSDDE